MALEEYLGLLNPTPQDRNEALTYGLLGLGSGLLQGSTGHYGQFGPALGAGLQSGMVNYRNAMQQGKENRLYDMQMAAKLEEIKQKQEEKARLNKLLSTLTPAQQTAYQLGGGDEVAKSLLPNKEKPQPPHYDATRGVWVESPTTANPGGRVIPLQGLPEKQQNPTDPYFTPIQTAEGIYRFNARTGNVDPIKSNGKQILGSGSDPNLKGKIAEETEKGKGRGEAGDKLSSMESSMPSLENTIGDLKGLSNKMTYTVAGKARDAVMRQMGVATEGGIAREKYINTVRDVLFPLLRQTFGAQFTVKEGEALIATLGNPDATPEERNATLDAFVEEKKRNIASLQRQTGAIQATQPTAGQWGIKRVK